MLWNDVKGVAELVQHIIVSVAAVVGGLWVLFRLNRERTDEAALNMTVSHESFPLEKNHLVSLTVVLENKGKTKIQARANAKGTYAFDDGQEKLCHGCSLQIKKVKPSTEGPCRLDWFESKSLVAVFPQDPNAPQSKDNPNELNLLLEYEDPKAGNVVDFWLEPGESYRLELPIVLPIGIYAGKVTFVAEKGDDNFWSQVFSFPVGVTAILPVAPGSGRGSETQELRNVIVERPQQASPEALSIKKSSE